MKQSNYLSKIESIEVKNVTEIRFQKLFFYIEFFYN